MLDPLFLYDYYCGDGFYGLTRCHSTLMLGSSYGILIVISGLSFALLLIGIGYGYGGD